MHDFMIKIGYHPFQDRQEFDKYLTTLEYSWVEDIFAEEMFPLYMKLAAIVDADYDNQIAVFSHMEAWKVQ